MKRDLRRHPRWWWTPVVVATAVLALSTGQTAASPRMPPWRWVFPAPTERARILIGDEVLIAEIADTPELQYRGLGYREGLEPGSAMLFVYDGPANRSFWMKGMTFCLDIVWIEEGRIVGAAERACPSPGVADADLPRFRSPEPVTYVLEVPAGWLDEQGVATGDPVRIEFPDS